jgi:hypothetical protein
MEDPPMIRVIFDPTPDPDDKPGPSWQPDLFLPMCATSLAQQGELFPDGKEPERKPAKSTDTDQGPSLF